MGQEAQEVEPILETLDAKVLLYERRRLFLSQDFKTLPKPQ